MTVSRGMWWGLILIALGLIILLNNLGIIDIGDLIRTYWPVLVIVWGLRLLMRRSDSPWEKGGAFASNKVIGDSVGASGEDRLSCANTFGDVNVRVTSQVFKGGDVSTVFGDIELDMTATALAEGEHLLRLSGVFGDQTVILPRDTAFAVDCTTVFGDVQCGDDRRTGISPRLNYESPGFAAAPKRLRVKASQVFGDIRVRN